jgi:hypothetical protein
MRELGAEKYKARWSRPAFTQMIMAKREQI